MAELNKSGIYKITNTITNKIYVGSALNILKRWYRHKTHANGGYHHSIVFQRSWDLHGKDVFEIEVLEFCDKEKLAEREQLYLDWLKPYNPNIGYNICDSSTTKVGMKRSEQAKENMRQAQLGKKQSIETIAKRAASIAKPDKWPCPDRSRCKCDKCREAKNDYIRERRWDKEIKSPPKEIKPIKWGCPDKIYCKCDKCKKMKNDMNKKYYWNKQ